MGRIFFAVVAALVLGLGCSSNKEGLEPRGDFYKEDQLGDFLADTAPPQQDNEYIIAVGDKLDVVFFIHRELTTTNLLVRTDGRITLPYVGDVMAAGYTPMQLDSTLTAEFSEVLREPNLSVIVKQPAEKIVYVLGQVVRGGGYDFQTNISLVQAVARAGGLERGAKADHIVVIRREGLDRVVGIEVSLNKITSGYNVGGDFWLRNYDIVYVPKTPLQSTADLMTTVDEILRPPVDIIFRGWQIKVLQDQYEFLRAR
jgi:polysaccharide export outer membrane protein